MAISYTIHCSPGKVRVAGKRREEELIVSSLDAAATVEIPFIINSRAEDLYPLSDPGAEFVIETEFADLAQRVFIIMQGSVVTAVVLISQTLAVQFRMAILLMEDIENDRKNGRDRYDE